MFFLIGVLGHYLKTPAPKVHPAKYRTTVPYLVIGSVLKPISVTSTDHISDKFLAGVKLFDSLNLKSVDSTTV